MIFWEVKGFSKLKPRKAIHFWRGVVATKNLSRNVGLKHHRGHYSSGCRRASRCDCLTQILSKKASIPCGLTASKNNIPCIVSANAQIHRALRSMNYITIIFGFVLEGGRRSFFFGKNAEVVNCSSSTQSSKHVVLLMSGHT